VRLLVTGGAGYIGGVVTLHLLKAGHRVTVLDDLSTGHADAVPDGATFVPGDLAERAGTVLADGDPYDGVLHFAAKALVAESVEHPERYWRTNVAGTLALLDAMRVNAVPRLVFSSTAPPTASRTRCPSRRPRRPGRPTRTGPRSWPST
jgi:UDP-glucose 4-epimerase